MDGSFASDKGGIHLRLKWVASIAALGVLTVPSIAACSATNTLYSCTNQGRKGTVDAVGVIKEALPSASVQIVSDCDSGGEYTLAISGDSQSSLRAALERRFICIDGSVESQSRGSSLDCSLLKTLSMNFFFPESTDESVEGLVISSNATS